MHHNAVMQISAVLLAALLTPSLLAQVPSFRAETRLVEVPVVVIDKKTGKPVTDLTIEDFELLEGGRRQKISYFHVHGSDEAAPRDTRPKLPDGVFTNRVDLRTEGGVPLVVVVVDAYNARFEDVYYAARAAAKVIGEWEGSARWGIYVISRLGLRVLHDYSEDRDSLIRSLRDLRGEGGTLGDGNAAEGMLEALSGISVGSMPEVRRHEFRLRVIETLESVRSISRHIGAIPGRKSLIWLTAGMSVGQMIGTEPLLFRDTINGVNDANVAIYTVDSAGLRTGARLAETPGPRTITGGRIGGGGGMWRQTEFHHVMAKSTGGRAFTDRNDLENGITSAIDDSRFFYRLAYSPEHDRWKGQYVPIKVKVRRRGVEVRHREGYLARPLQPLPVEDRNKLLTDALLSPLDSLEIELRVSLRPVEEGAELYVSVAPGGISMIGDGQRFQGALDLRYAQRSVDGTTLEDFTDELTMDLAEAEATRVREDGVIYRREVLIRPETKSIRLAVCDRASGRVGSILVPVP
jgi:VWFA-related protein